MMTHERRRFLGAVAAGIVVGGCTRPRHDQPAINSGTEEEEVSPPEDLMREHGVLNRILLVYEDCISRMENQKNLPVDAIAKSADIIHNFIEQYHEKLEEDYLFPRFEKAGKLLDLVATLRRQHLAGRALTDSIRQLANPGAVAKAPEQKLLASSMRAFIRMYRPHEAREDTILFPNFRSVVSGKEFRDLAEQFEDREHALFGKEGFEGIVGQVESIERELGLYQLDQFTPT